MIKRSKIVTAGQKTFLGILLVTIFIGTLALFIHPTTNDTAFLNKNLNRKFTSQVINDEFASPSELYFEIEEIIPEDFSEKERTSEANAPESTVEPEDEPKIAVFQESDTKPAEPKTTIPPAAPVRTAPEPTKTKREQIITDTSPHHHSEQRLTEKKINGPKKIEPEKRKEIVTIPKRSEQLFPEKRPFKQAPHPRVGNVSVLEMMDAQDMELLNRYFEKSPSHLFHIWDNSASRYTFETVLAPAWSNGNVPCRAGRIRTWREPQGPTTIYYDQKITGCRNGNGLWSIRDGNRRDLLASTSPR